MLAESFENKFIQIINSKRFHTQTNYKVAQIARNPNERFDIIVARRENFDSTRTCADASH